MGCGDKMEQNNDVGLNSPSTNYIKSSYSKSCLFSDEIHGIKSAV
jgi:hypothetical protein